MMKAITPLEALSKSASLIPPQVFEVVNNLIIENLDLATKSLTLKQDLIVESICNAFDISRNKFNFNWLNFEAQYEEQGWIVKYEKQCFGDNFDSYFEFKIRT